MLLEMLASERSEEPALHIGRMFGRDITADHLCAHGLASRVDVDHLVFTDIGRHVAERLVTQIFGEDVAARLAS